MNHDSKVRPLRYPLADRVRNAARRGRGARLCQHAGQVDHILVGADHIASNGDFANKVGTYMLAVLANYHGVPFYVVAPGTTIDRQCSDGASIPIEQRGSDEVRGVSGSFGQCKWAPDQAPVYNPAFDVTPAALVSGWVLDSGVVTPDEVKAGALAV